MKNYVYLPEAIDFLFGKGACDRFSSSQINRFLDKYNVWYSTSYSKSACITRKDFNRLVKIVKGE